MLNIKVLGPGCTKCYSLEQTAASALEALLNEQPNLEVMLKHIEDILEIERYSVLFTPALVVNEKLVCAGRVPKQDEIIGWYRKALSQPA